MKVYVFSDGVRHGCYIYREEIPLEALERRGHTIEGGLMHPGGGGNLADTDIFVFPRLAAMDYPLVVDEIKRNGKPLVYEMDDAADLFERYHTSYFQVKNLLPSYYFFLREADLVTTTTEHLARHFRSLGARRVEVLPNCPPPGIEWVDPPKLSREPVRIGFTGWTAHIMDAAFWFEVIDSLRRLRQDFVPVLFGISNTSDTGPEWMDKCKDAVNQNPIPNYEFGQSLLAFRRGWLKVKDYLEWHSMVTVDDYWRTLTGLHLDIGCAALIDSPFNRCKSCVKFYDFASAGAVTVASDVLPYSEEPVVAVPNTVDAWVRMLSLLIESQLHRQHRLHEQREWIRENRDADRWAVAREQVYESLLVGQPV